MTAIQPGSSHIWLPSRHELIGQARQFALKKHLGQNFLIDPDELARITQALSPGKQDEVLEIGPGLGFLTRYLCSSGASVTAVELDAGLAGHLKDFNMPGLNVIEDDFLSFDTGKLIGKLKAGQKLKVAGNVPYQITSKIIARLFGEIDRPCPWLKHIETVVLTVQLEVARRFTAVPGQSDYSQITLLVNFFSRPELLHVVPAESFFPAPQVDSAVVRFTPHAVPPVACRNMKLLRQLIQAGFRQRRKMLRNNLSFLPLPVKDVLDLFGTLHLDPQTRAERLSLAQFAALADALDLRLQAGLTDGRARA